MALKRKASEGEQLYILEISVDKVDLKSNETSPATVEDVTLFVYFNDLPHLEITFPDQSNRSENESTENLDDFKFGKSRMFAKTPSSLIKAIKCAPLFVEVYRKEPAAVNKNGSFLGTARMSLPECMCNHVSSARKETDELSEPCIVKESLDLINSNGKVAGKVFIALRLSCLGSSSAEQLSSNKKSFVLDDAPRRKIHCPPPVDEEKDSGDKTLLKRPDSPPRIPIDDPAFKRLTTAEKLNDPRFRELIYKIYPDEPTCRCLPVDRSTHPMVCRSGCRRSCCMKLRNPDTLDTQDRHVDDALVNTYCVKDFGSTKCGRLPPRKTAKCSRTPKSRLRGGGDIEQIYLDPVGYKWTDYDTDYPWYDEKNNMEIRLEGGGGGEDASSCSCTGGKVPLHKSSSKDTEMVAILDACKPRVLSTGPQPGCTCPGKNIPGWFKGAAKCSKKPCMGIDCLIRAFNETQAFVDSIGKVPGLAGLGLLDPSESPYFGRDIDKDYVSQKQPEERKKAVAKSSQPALTVPSSIPPCTAICSNKPGKTQDIHSPLLPTSHHPISYAVPPRLGIVREAIPVIPETGVTVAARHRKKEEKAEKHKEMDNSASALDDMEMGPCNEPKCKSRKKKPPENGSMTQSATQISSKRGRSTTDGPKKPRGKGRGGVGSSRGSSRHRSQKAKLHGGADARGKVGERDKFGRPIGNLGPGGDRSPQQHQTAISVSKRVMRYVYFVGDLYPGIYYGHKDCIDIPMRVPSNMGWLWNTMNTLGFKPRIGWRPGAIGRNLYEMLQEAKENSMANLESMSRRTRSTDRAGDRSGDRGGRMGDKAGRGRSVKTERLIDRGRTKSVPPRGRSQSKRRSSRGFAAMQRTQTTEDEEQGPEAPPTLHIHRKDGTYYVTMYPIRPETSDEPRLPEPMKPLQFKIVKNKDEASDASSSSASDMEIEFSPPAAVARYRKKPDVIHVDTQVRQQQILDAYKTADTGKKEKKGKKDKGEKSDKKPDRKK